MKRIYKFLVLSCLMAIVSIHSFAVVYHPTSCSVSGGPLTFCQNAASSSLTLQYLNTVCGSGGANVAAGCTYTLYYNTTNTTTISGATVTVISATGFTDASNTVTQTLQTYSPSTALTPGTYYYFMVVSWTGVTGGACYTLSGSITSATTLVIINPSPTINSVTSSNSCLTGGSPSTTLQCNATISGGSINATGYTWSPAIGTTSSSGTASPSVNTVYTVTASATSGGCVSSYSTVAVYRIPTVSVATNKFCPGATITENGTGSNLWAWTPGTGLNGVTGNAVTYTLTTASSPVAYTVTGSSTAGCSSTATFTVSVPSVSGNFSVSPGSVSCSGNATLSPAGLTPTAWGGAFLNYTWSGPSGWTTTTTAAGNATLTTTAGVSWSGLYSVVAVYAGTGCSSTADVSTNSFRVLGGAYNLTGDGVSPAYGCTAAGTTMGLSNTDAGVTYSLTLTSGAHTTYTVSGTGAARNFNGGSPILVAGTYTANSSCPVAMIGSVTVVSSITSFSITPYNGVGCNTGVTIGLSGSQIGVVYQLYNGGSIVGSPIIGTGAALSFGLNTSAGTYSVATINGDACSNTAMLGTVTINSGSGLTIATTPTSATMCSGASAAIAASGAGTGGTYSWLPNDGTLNTVTGANVTASPTGTETYTVTGTGVTGCTGTATVFVDQNLTPSAVTFSTTNPLTVCTSAPTQTLTANASTASSAPNFVYGGGFVNMATTNQVYSNAVSVTGIPTTAVVDSVHVYVSGQASGGLAFQTDMQWSIQGPTGSILGLSTNKGNTGAGAWAGTWFSSQGGFTLVAGTPIASNVQYAADAGGGAGSPGDQTTSSWSDLFSYSGTPGTFANGTWTLLGSENYGLNTHKFTAYSVSVYYHVPVTYVWSPSTYLSSTTSTSVTYSTGGVSGPVTTYTLTASDGECSSFNTYAVTTNPLPTISGTFSMNPISPPCTGGTVNFVPSTGFTTSGIGDGGVSYYTWTGPTGVVATNASSAGSFNMVNSAQNGTYSMSVTYADAGCTSTYTLSTNALAMSGPTSYNLGLYNAGVVSFPAFGCTSGGVNIGLNNSGSFTYVLSRVGVGGVSTVTSSGGAFSFGTFNTAGTYTAGVSGGCSAVMIGSVTVVASVTTESITPYNGVGCSSSGVAIGLNTSQAGVVYQLYLAGTGAQGSAVRGTGAAISFGSYTAAGTYSVATVNGGSCSGTAMLGTVTINSGSALTLSCTPSSATYCSGTGGSTPSLVASGAGGTGVYVWTPNTGLSSYGTNSVSANAAPSSSTTYTINATGAGGCTGNTTVSVGSFNQPTAPVISPSSITMCNAASVQPMSVTATSGLANFSASGSNNTSYSFTYAAPAASPIAISGIPAGATITSVIVTFNVNFSAFVGYSDVDYAFDLMAPNGQIINLEDNAGGFSATSPFNNIQVVSTGGVSNFAYGTSISSANNPYNAQLVSLTSGMGSYNTTSTAWSSLYSGTVNGNWSFIAGTPNNTTSLGTISNWNIKVYYTAPVSYTWSNITNLYANSSGATGYSGGATSNVWVGPSTPTGAVIYTVSANNSGCITNTNVTVTTNGNPSVTGTFTLSPGVLSCATVNHPGDKLTILNSLTPNPASGGADGAITSYAWSGPTGLVATTASGNGSFSVTSSSEEGTYSVTITYADPGCVVTSTVTTTLNISGTNVYTVTGNLINPPYFGCTSSGNYSIGLSGSDLSFNYLLYNGSTNVGTIAGTGAALVMTVTATAGIYSVFASGGTCTANMQGTTALVNSITSYSIQPYNGVGCGGSGVPITLNSSQTGIYYQLYNGSSPVGSAVVGTGASISFGTQFATGTYSVGTVNGDCYLGMLGTVTIGSGSSLVISCTPSSAQLCSGGTTSQSLVASGAGTGTYVWSPTVYLSASTGASVTAAPTVDNVVYTVTATGAGGCTGYTVVPVNYNITPATPSVSPNSIAACVSASAQTMAATSTVSGGLTVSSGSVGLSIPTTTPELSTLTMSGIPAGATITSVTLTYSVSVSTSTQPGFVINLQAPDNAIINLQNSNGAGSGTESPVITTGGSTAFSGTAISNGTYKANLTTVNTIPGYHTTATAWSSLYTTPNGQWSLILYDATGTGVLNNWALTVYYSTSSPTFAWSGSSGAATSALSSTSTASVSVTIPASSATYNYSLTATNSGCAATSVATSTVSTNVLPLSSFTVSPTSSCLGGNVVLTATNPTGTGAGNFVKYAWKGSDGFNSNISTITTTTVSASPALTGTVTYSLNVTFNGAGCISSTTTNTLNVTAGATATITPTTGNICNGTLFSATEVGGSGITPSYTWMYTNGGATTTMSGTTATNTLSVSPTGNYTVSISVSDAGCASGGPVAASYTVNAIPVITGVNSPTVCSGSNAVLIATVTGTSVTNYAITMSGGSFTGLSGSFAATTTPTLTLSSGATASGVYTGTLSVTSAVSCTSANKVFTVTVNSTPTLTAIASQTICSGNTVILTPTVTGTNVTNYAITMSGGSFTGLSGSFASTTTPTLNVVSGSTAAGVYSGTLTVTSALSCSSATQVFSVTVNSTPTLTAIASQTICAGNNEVLTPTVTGTNVTNYAITMSGGSFTGLSGSFAATLTPTLTIGSGSSASGVYTGTLSVTSALSCISANKVFTVTVSAIPTATLAATATTICSGSVVSLSVTGTANAAIGLSPSGTFTLNGSGIKTYTVNPSVSTTYSISTVTSAAGCSQAGVGSATITVNTTPVLSAITTPTVCAGSSFSLNPTVSGLSVNSYTISVLPALYFTPLSGTFAATTSPSITVGTSYSLTLAPGTYPALLNVSTGACVSAATIFSVTVNPTPIATNAVAPASVCIGTPWTFISTVVATPVVSYNLSEPTGSFTGTSGSFASTYTPTVSIGTSGTPGGVYSATLTLTSALGCTSPNNNIYGTLTVNATPTGTITGTTTICNGTAAVLSVTGTPNTGITLSPAGSFTLDGSGKGTYTVSPSVTTYYSITSLVSGPGCPGSGTGSATVTVNATPTGTITGTQSICTGTVATLSVSGTPSAGVHFSDGGSITLDGLGNGTYTVAPSITTGYTITSLLSPAVCAGSGTGVAVVSINAIPTGTITGTTTICNGSVVTLSVTGTPGTGVNLSDGGNITLDGSGNGTYTVAPSSNTTYTISSLTSSAGCPGSGTGNAVVTVNAIPTATITGSTALCIGSTATLNISGSAGATVYISDGGNDVLDGSGSGTYTVAPVVNTTYTISSITSVASCTVGSGTGSAVITMNAQPTATVTGAATICSGSSAIITATGTPNAIVYFSDGGTFTLDFSGVYNYTVSPSVTTDYTITNVDNLSTGCMQAGTGDALITVNPMPTATVTGTTSICTGGSAVLSVAGLAGASVTFSDGGNISLSVGGSGSYSVSPSSTTVYTISTVSLSGCSQAGSGSAVITVNSIPTATVSGTTTLCSGSTATLTVVGSAGAGVNFSDGGNISLDGSGNGTYTVTPSSSTTYNITSVVSGAGCSGSGSGSAVITVDVVSSATITGTATICTGAIATLSVIGTAGANATLSDGGIVGIALSGVGVYTTIPSISTTYTISSLSSGLGCPGAGSGSAIVTVNAVPTATVSGTTTLCSGSTATLTATGTAGAYLTFSDGGNTTLDGSGNGSYIVTPPLLTMPVTYTIVSVSLSGCSQAGSGSAVVTVNAMPTATVSGTSTICSGASAVLTVAGSANASIAFSDGGNINLDISGNGTYTVAPSATTTYNVIVSYTATGCSEAGTGSALVTVNALPTATITGTTTICAGSSAILPVSGTASATVNISDGGNVVLDGSGNGNYTVTPSSTNTYTISSVVNGCTGSGSGSAVVTVNAAPTSTISGTTTIFIGDVATLSLTGTPSATVTVTGGSVVLNGFGYGVFTVSPSSTTVYNITGVTASVTGCTGTGTGSVTVNVNALPTATLTGTTSTCNGISVNLPVTGSAGATVTFSDGGNVTLDGTGHANYNVTPSTTTTYTITSVNILSYYGTGYGSAVVTVYAIPTASISPVPSSCWGYSTAVTFNGTPSAVVSYSVTGGSILTGTFNSGTGNFVVPIPPSTIATVTLISVTNGGICYTGLGLTATVTPTSITWQGGISTNWNTASNWNCNVVPTSTDVVAIPNTATQPIINTGTVGNTGNLTISSGATVTIQSTGNLNVYGNFGGTGVVTGAGTLSLVGTATQTISGHVNVGNMKLNNSHGAIMSSIADSLFINGILSLTSGTFTTLGNGNLVIVTDSNGTSGQIGTIPSGGGSISGNVTMKQYIRFGHRAYRFWGHPFTVSIPLSQLENYIDISGTGGTTNGFTHTITDAPTAFWYDNRLANAALSLDPGWVDFKTCNSNPANPSDTNNFKQFEGIRILDRGYKGQGLDGATYTPGTSIIGDYGPINMGNENIPIKNYGTGKAYNTISNPYPSPVDIGTVIFNASQAGRILGNMFYVWDPYLSTAGAYANIAYINTVTTTAIPFYIAPNTSFQVRAVSSASVTPVYLNFTEANKSTTVSPVPGTSVPGDLRSIEVPGFTMLTVYDNNYHPYDMWYMNFNGEATDGEDEKLDGGKPVNPDLNFYSWSADNTKLAADARPYESGKIIPLGFYTDLAQPYIIKVSSYAAPDGAQVYLHDKLLNTYTKLEQGAEYKFNITTDARTQGDNRFEINLDPTGITQPENGKMLVSMMPNPTNDEVNISFSAPIAGNTTIRVVDITGVCVYSENLGIMQTGKTSISLAGFASGVYMVEITNGDNEVVLRLVKE